MIYRRRELWLLLFLAAGLAVGLAVRQFRAGFPDLAEHLEQFDVEETTGPAKGAGAPAPAKLAATDARRDGRLDLNRATPADLQRLPGIGPALAQRIVEARERQGRFRSPEDLRRVPGIGSKKLEAIRELVTVSE